MAKKNSSDLDWEKFGQTDPYFGVCTDEIFRSSNLTEEALKTFFETGKKHVDHVFDVLNWMSGTQIKCRSILDFGCGTGRLVLPFAARAERVTGVDVSPSMLREAGKNIKSLGIDNVELIQSNSLAILNDREFDLVHTYIVLQHIPVSSGYEVIRSLLNAMGPKGYAMIQFTYRNDQSAVKNLKYHLQSNYKLVAQLSNVMKGKSVNAPYIQMNNYSLNRVIRMIEKAGINNFYTEFTDHGGFHGVNLYMQKS